MIRPPCETGYICSDPATGAGCGRLYDRDPNGSGAWWFTCECGETAGPATKAEAQGQLRLEVA